MNLVLLVSLRFPSFGLAFYLLLAAGVISSAIVIGHFHLRWQQKTDIMLQYEPLIQEIVKRLKE